jgi:putative membrane protein insertion efficiency factor
MGYCDSSTQHGGDGGIFSARARAGEIDSAQAVGASGTNSMGPSGRSLSTWISLALVQFYRIFLSHFFGGACKFYPSCSKYAQEAIASYGARRGIVLALKRLGRCRPFTKGGFDPVPDVYDGRASRDPRDRFETDVPPANFRHRLNAHFTEDVLIKHDEERIL